MSPKLVKSKASAQDSMSAPSQSKNNVEVNALIQLHTAEYQMLTTRCTYWIIMPTALWPILIGTLLLMTQVQALVKKPEILVWGAAILVQFVVLIHYETIIEVYRAVFYIEKVLRPRITDLLGDRPYWGYESYLSKFRSKEPLLWEYWPFGVSVLTTVVASAMQIPVYSPMNLVGFTICLVGIFLALQQARNATRTRKAWS
ncbi:MAG: hypothetical protein ABSD46_12025 [Bacteroidota bacterium]